MNNKPERPEPIFTDEGEEILTSDEDGTPLTTDEGDEFLTADGDEEN